jgi:hypothetical protein
MSANTIDHPLIEANRIVSSGVFDEAAMARIREEWGAGDRTPARLRASIFEVLGEGFRGRVPIAWEEVLDPGAVREGLEIDSWAAVGVQDESAVLELSGGDWFGLPERPTIGDRTMVLLLIPADEATALREQLDAGERPMWAVDPLAVLDMGPESAYRAAMAGD